MGTHLKIILIILLLLPSFPGCKNSSTQKENVPIALEDETSEPKIKVRQIFYNMSLPTEMSRIFERAGANYNPAFLNSADNISRYSNPNQMALNLGLYGVDLSYTRIFGQTASTAKYFSTIQLLIEKLGIPKSYYQDIINALDKYHDDKDSLTKLTGDIYERSEKFLKDNEKDSYAALIVMGGWIEALYIACKITESDSENMEIMDRIAEQKYSLNSLISLLNNYQDDLNITEYILMLKQLKKSFDKFEIFYSQDSFTFDTVNGLISASEYEIDISPAIISEIGSLITKIRMRIVN